jgi:hypothetical protein
MESLAWPLAVVVCIVAFFTIFRGPISDLIGRARRVGFGNKSIDLATEVQNPAAEQQKTLELPPATPEMVPATHVMPPASELTASIESEISNALTTSNFPANVEKAWLIRTVAALRIMRGHEIVYRLIVGSQINMLLLANTASPFNMSQAREIYELAKTTYPAIYTNFAFETWVNYPVSNGLLRIDADGTGPSILKITPLGQDFLHYLVNNSLTAPKVG